MAEASVDVKRSRSSKLPEHTEFRDKGCSVSKSCFICPLPVCRYESPGGLRTILNEMRDEHIREVYLTDLPIMEIATRFRVSRRTVFRLTSDLPRRREVVVPIDGVRHRVTQCPKGHAYDKENTYYNANGTMVCRACRREREWERIHPGKKYLGPMLNGRKRLA